MNKIKHIVEKELEAVDNKLNQLPVNNTLMSKELKDFINSPSKRIRSLCTILYFKSKSVKIESDFINILTIGELIHNASLLHDDVIDNSILRRGKPTIGKKYSPQISILSGDLLLSIATEMLIALNNIEIMKNFQKCINKMSTAEINQYFLRGKIPEIKDYISIAEGKTASLFEAIFKSCANITNTDITKAKNFAKNFGILFQLKNDIETVSAQIDKQNNIYTPKDILGIEKTHILIDNYFDNVRRDLEEYSESIYKAGLLDLLNDL